jgi:acetylornithine deacetylase/succinyl-diaminopimelate desuccinylase-like protein
LAANFQQIRDNLSGRLLVLFDADEHTGDFDGVTTFLHSYPKLDGVLIATPATTESSPAHAASTAHP